MKAIRYDFSIPNYLKVRASDMLPVKRLEAGKVPGLAKVEMPEPALRGSEWVRVRPLLSGICGSDISALTGRQSPALTPFFSYPFVPGHEVLAEVVESGADAGSWRPGQRVVINPVIGCEIRGLPPCRSCLAGDIGLCVNAAEGDLAPAMLIGFSRDLPGGWSQGMVVHRSQLHAVPDELSDETAVLVEPFSVALHAVLKAPPPPDAKVLLIGGGSIGLLVLAALRLTGNQADVTVLARYPVQEELALAFGATSVRRSGSAGDAAVSVAGAKRYKPLRGADVYTGGFDWVYDCVGSAGSVADALRVAGPKGRVVMVGCAAEVPKLDLTPVWAHELDITGCYVYGRETGIEGSPNTFDVAIGLLRDNPDFPLARMITHTFPLFQMQDALGVSLSRGRHAAVKVVFDCRGEPDRA